MSDVFEKMEEKKKRGIRPIPVCSVCGKVDSVKGDGHSCLQHIEQEEMNDNYYN